MNRKMLKKWNRQLGDQAESLAATFLLKKGLKILRRNLRTKLGEIDILAKDKDTLVVVEVKAKTDSHQGQAIEMINHAKQRKLILLAFEMQKRFKTTAVRIDAVTVDEWSDQPKIRHLRSAVELNA